MTYVLIVELEDEEKIGETMDKIYILENVHNVYRFDKDDLENRREHENSTQGKL